MTPFFVDATEDSSFQMTLMWLEPKDPNTVQQIFDAMKHCQSLHPDPADSISDDDDFMEAEDAGFIGFDDVGQGDLRNLRIDG